MCPLPLSMRSSQGKTPGVAAMPNAVTGTPGLTARCGTTFRSASLRLQGQSAEPVSTRGRWCADLPSGADPERGGQLNFWAGASEVRLHASTGLVRARADPLS